MGYYSSEPAPMGIADFGVGHDGVPYAYNTSEFLGNFTWENLSVSGSGGTEFTVQLNVVLKFVEDASVYAYWIQDVAFVDSSDGALSFENNIWNFSSSAGCLSAGGLSGNGTVYSYDGCQGYYAVSAESQPGAFETMPSPGNFQLLVRSYLSPSGEPEVAFEYRDGVTSWYVTYDNVVWPWARGVSADDGFVVDGTQYNPMNLFYDAELTIGGPGGGRATEAINETHATSQLLFWNGNNFQAPIAAYNFGSNTAEAVSDLQSIDSSDSGGAPRTLQLDGTARNASPARAYDQEQVGFLHISAPGVSSGYVAVQNDDWSFVGDAANLTLVPGTYTVWVNSSGVQDPLGQCTITAGTTLDANTTDGCVLVPSVSTPRASVSSVDLGQSVTFTSTLGLPGSGGDSYAWATTPSGLDCAASSSLSLSCTPTAEGRYEVNVSATDSDGVTGRSGTLGFEVYADPSAPAPVPSRATVETGGSVKFTESVEGGASPYSFTWTGLPTPCTGTTGNSPSCLPATAGTYPISVRITDSNGEGATSTAITYTVEAGPSVAPPSAGSSDAVDVGQSVNFSTRATGGSGSYTYHWVGLPSGCASENESTLECRPNGTGTGPVSVYATDTGGGNATSAPLEFTVDPSLSLVVTASSRVVDAGEAAGFRASASGGSGVYSFDWAGLPAGCVNSAAANLTCVPRATGTFVVLARATDSNGGVVERVVNWTVLVDPSVASFSASPGDLTPGSPVTFGTSVEGGLAPYSFQYSGLPPGCSSIDRASFSCTPSASGTYTVTVTVTDANGMPITARTQLTVQSEIFGLPANEAYLLLGLGAAAAVLGALSVVWVRRRERRRSGPS